MLLRNLFNMSRDDWLILRYHVPRPFNLHECQLVIVLYLPSYLAVNMPVLENSCIKLLRPFPLGSISPFQTSEIVTDIVFLATVDHYSPVTTKDNGDSVLELSHPVSEQEHLYQMVTLCLRNLVMPLML